MGLDGLPAVFRLDQALRAGVSKDRVYHLRDTGALDQIGRGVYARPGALDPALTPLAVQ